MLVSVECPISAAARLWPQYVVNSSPFGEVYEFEKQSQVSDLVSSNTYFQKKLESSCCFSILVLSSLGRDTLFAQEKMNP